MELAREAGVTPSVLKGLEETGTLIAEAAPRDAPYARLDPARPGAALSDAQAEAAAALRASVAAQTYSTTLLKGVTGSGKTEVYLEAVAEALRQGRQALVLLPEIALTSAFLKRFRDRFGAPPAEWHSAATEGERRRCWRAAASGEAQVVVGARSALFLPFADLGLVVVDEEHDTAYKQEEGALYHARDMAVLRASLNDAAVVLASATPSLESWANAEAGKYARLDLPERFGPAVLPEIRAIDMREHAPPTGQWISDPLAEGVAARLQRGEQALLFTPPSPSAAPAESPSAARIATPGWWSTAGASA
jgi:primosomal protein N' (replication factor Y)